MSDRPDTRRPASNDPADIAVWEQEKHAKERRLDEEREFRDKMLEFAGETRERLRGMGDDITGMRGEIGAHEQRDKERFAELDGRFGPVTQSIGSTGNKVHWIIGIGVGATGIVALVGLYLSLRGTP